VPKTKTFWNVRENDPLRGNIEVGREHSRVFPVRDVREREQAAERVGLSFKFSAVQFSGVERSWIE
jgi:hypothetical protein